MRVEHIMTKDPICGEVPGNRTDALRLLVKNNISGIPVVKKGTRKLVGMVTRKDIFKKPREEQLALVMKKDLITITPATRVETAAKLFLKHQIHRLPVVSGENVVGIVTPVDILKVIEELEIKEPVEHFMSQTFVPIYESTPISVAMTIMDITGMTALPVLDKNSRLCGIVTDSDLFKRTRINKSLRKSDIGLGEDEDAWSWEGFRNIMKFYYEIDKVELPVAPISKVMVRDVRSVFRKTPINKVARDMRKYDIGQLPVKDSADRLFGMIYDLDLMTAIIKK